MNWSKGLAEWIEGDTAYISVVFSWRLPEAYQRAVWLSSQGYKVRAGGPATFARPRYLEDVADLGGTVDALIHHNPDATMASRGCPVKCYFCIVPNMEGIEFTLLPDFTPRPILCDNNLSALPVDYQEYIIEKYTKSGVRLSDCNSGFEPRTFDSDTYNRWRQIYKGRWRFGYDENSEGVYVKRMTVILKDEKQWNKRVFVLIGNEPFESCYERIMKVIEWGCEPYAQPMIALNSLTKKPIIRYDWTPQKLKDLARWTNRWNWRYFPFSEYNRGGKPTNGSDTN